MIDSSGRIVVAGLGNSASGNNFLIARFLSNGALDPSFGQGGFVLINFLSSTSEWAEGLAIDGSGKIVVAGIINVGGLNRIGSATE